MSKKREIYQQFSEHERLLIFEMREEGKSLREIGIVLRRGNNAAGSISRELRQNRPESPFLRARLKGLEAGREAHKIALKRRKHGKKKKKLADNELRRKVIDLLVNEQASPRDIQHRLLEEGIKVAYTTIYSFTKKERPDLRQYHRLRGKSRKQRVVRPRNRFKKGSPDKKRIYLRAVEVLDRTDFGHLEADTIHSCKGGSGSAILSIRERSARYREFKWLSGLTAEETLSLMIGFYRLLPAHMRKTLTVDNGPENSLLWKLEEIFPGLQVYYCDPYQAWQRGGVENANGEFRWYFPKGTDFGNVSSKEIWEVQDKLNRKRMRCLEWRSAQSVYAEAVLSPKLVRVVGPQEFQAGKYFEGIQWQQGKSNLFLPSPGQSDLGSFYSGSSGQDFLWDGRKFEIPHTAGRGILKPPQFLSSGAVFGLPI